MKIEMMAIDRVVPYIRNPRINTEAAVSKVKSSLHEFGWRQPIVVDKEYTIVVGHTRYLAAKQLGLTEVPVHVADNLSPAQIKAYRITDNRSAQESKWDDELLKIEFADLKLASFDLSLTAFDTSEIDLFINDNEVINSMNDGQTKEIDTDDFVMDHKCPKCGFEFDDKT